VVRSLNCSVTDIRVFNITAALPTEADLADCDAVLMGGSGAFHIYSPDPWVGAMLGYCAERLQFLDKPFFGMCFGYQAMIHACGGEVRLDKDREELGVYELELTEEGLNDPIFAGAPPRLEAQFGHKDRAITAPDGWLNLASTPLCPLQAFRIPGRLIWGFQFHAELRLEDNLHRIHAYATNYGVSNDGVLPRTLADRLRPTPTGSNLLSRFVTVVEHHMEST
jgi:GMP synthase (glutamine-hydrolysing)